ncbi:sulfatase [soil metagenome]
MKIFSLYIAVGLILMVDGAASNKIISDANLNVSTVKQNYLPANHGKKPALLAKRPNIVWILSEDNSKHYLKLFDPDGVETPHIEKLAKQGVIFDHAFSNSPVCSVARSTLITGTYAPRTAIHMHRKIKLAPMPDGLEMFPFYLRNAGYYTTNNAKKDYNAVEGEGVWNESSDKAIWRNRPDAAQPFFHMQTHMESHESRLHFDSAFTKSHQTQTNPQKIKLPPYFPDNSIFRFTKAYYLDKMREIDNLVGKTVALLEEDGLLEDTFIFYFGDHGGVLPRSKGYLYEGGLHIPLVVRIPENWKHLVEEDFEKRMEGFVSFVDFAPTVLQLAGLAIPRQMDGKPFLGKGVAGKEINSRDEAFGHADRFDEKYDMVRSLRKGKWKYIRNYQPFLPDALQNNYRYEMLAYSQWRDLFQKGQLNEIQSQFFLPKPVEMLFDLETDPHEVNNLSQDTSHQKVLINIRQNLHEKFKNMPDLGFLPESFLVSEAMENPVAFGTRSKSRIQQLILTADLAVLPFEEAKEPLKKALGSQDELIRYWALIVCSSLGKTATEMIPVAKELLSDQNLMVRLRAIEFLAMQEFIEAKPYLMEILNTTENSVEALLTLNTLVYFRDHTDKNFSISLKDLNLKVRNDEVERRMNYLFPSSLTN